MVTDPAEFMCDDLNRVGYRSRVKAILREFAAPIGLVD